MKVLTFSTKFPTDHPRKGEPTWFVEQILSSILPRPLTIGLSEFPAAARDYINDFFVIDGSYKKGHTIRAGSRFKPGDMASLRIWSGRPFHTKQIEFAQVEVKKVWEFNIHVVGDGLIWQMPGIGSGDFDTKSNSLKIISKNDGLEIRDFIDGFVIHPNAKERVFTGQIISWDSSIEYSI